MFVCFWSPAPFKERLGLQTDAGLQDPLKDPLFWCQHWKRNSSPSSLDHRQYVSWGDQHPAGVQRAEPPHPGPSVPGLETDTVWSCLELYNYILSSLVKWSRHLNRSFKTKQCLEMWSSSFFSSNKLYKSKEWRVTWSSMDVPVVPLPMWWRR